MSTYRIRHYDGPSYDDLGRHVGRWREVKFNSKKEAKQYQRMHGGTLYHPKTYARPKKGKRADQLPAVEQVGPVGQASRGEDGATGHCLDDTRPPVAADARPDGPHGA